MNFLSGWVLPVNGLKVTSVCSFMPINRLRDVCVTLLLEDLSIAVIVFIAENFA